MTLVLIVEDDARFVRLLSQHLEAHELQVLTAKTGREGITSTLKEYPDVILLDLGLPDMDGSEVLRELRPHTEASIIIISARHDQRNIVRGLRLGADDYLSKPFGLPELIARIHANVRRANRFSNGIELHHTKPQVIDYKTLHIDVLQASVTNNGSPVELTATEFRLLTYLLASMGRVVTSNQILEAVWGAEYIGDPHLVRVYISRLRKKIELDPGNPRVIVTRFGIGYHVPTPPSTTGAE
jgi:DNA-binding response OmpR family regulator